MPGLSEEQPFSSDLPYAGVDEPVAHDRGPLTALVGELLGETTALIRAEMALARAEMHENLRGARHGVASLGAGAVALTAGLFALVAAAILALAQIWPNWLAALVVGLAIAALGAVLIEVGKRKTGPSGLTPHRTLSSLQDDREFARHERERATRKWR